jgi:hypothetical protein
MNHLKAIGLILALSALTTTVQAQTGDVTIQRKAQEIHDLEVEQAIQECRTFQNYDDHVFVYSSRPGNAAIDIYEMVNTPDQMIDCIDAIKASVVAYGKATTATKPYVDLTLRQSANMTGYANNHFPSRYMAHTYEQ